MDETDEAKVHWIIENELWRKFRFDLDEKNSFYNLGLLSRFLDSWIDAKWKELKAK